MNVHAHFPAGASSARKEGPDRSFLPQHVQFQMGFLSGPQGGNQKLTADLSQLEYGKSITDGCLDWDSTVTAMRNLRDMVKDVLPNR